MAGSELGGLLERQGFESDYIQRVVDAAAATGTTEEHVAMLRTAEKLGLPTDVQFVDSIWAGRIQTSDAFTTTGRRLLLDRAGIANVGQYRGVSAEMLEALSSAEERERPTDRILVEVGRGRHRLNGEDVLVSFGEFEKAGPVDQLLEMPAGVDPANAGRPVLKEVGASGVTWRRKLTPENQEWNQLQSRLRARAVNPDIVVCCAAPSPYGWEFLGEMIDRRDPVSRFEFLADAGVTLIMDGWVLDPAALAEANEAFADALGPDRSEAALAVFRDETRSFRRFARTLRHAHLRPSSDWSAV